MGNLTTRLVDRATAYQMEVGIKKKSTIVANSMSNSNAGISMNGRTLEEVISFNCLGATLCKDGICSAEVLISIGPAMARRNRIWRCKAISFASMFNLYKFLGKMHVCVYGEGRGVREASDSR